MQALLRKVGLTETEAKIYSSLLALGQSTAGAIIKHASLNSGRVYEVFSSLEQKGLLSIVVQNKIKTFIPAPPERIRELLAQQQKQIEDIQNEFESYLPSLTQQYAAHTHTTTIETYTGVEGFKTAYNIFLSQAETSKELFIQGIMPIHAYPKQAKKILDVLFYSVYAKRKALGLRIKKLIDESAREEKAYARDGSQRRYLNLSTFTSVEILGETVMVQLMTEPFIVFLIHNPQVAQDYKKQFLLLWKHAKA